MDYKEYLRKLEENKKYYISKYGKDTYNRYRTYYSTKASGTESEYVTRMDKLMENQDDYLKRYGTKTVDRYMNYYALKSTGLDKASPSMQYLDKMMDNQDDYINKYGQKEFDEYFSFYSSNVNKELGKAYKVIEKNPYSTRVFEPNPQLAELFTYSDDEEDVLRQALGYTPKSFDKAAKEIAKKAKAVIEESRKRNRFEAYFDEQLESGFDWDSLKEDEPITESKLREYIAILTNPDVLEQAYKPRADEERARQAYADRLQEPVQEPVQEPRQELTPEEKRKQVYEKYQKRNEAGREYSQIETAANQLLENNINAINEYYDKEAELIKSEYDLSAINTYVPVTATNGNVVKSTSGNPVMALSAEAAQAEINSEKMNERIAENEKARKQALKDAPYLIEEQKTALQLAQQAAADPEFQNNIDDYVKQFDTEIAKQTVMGGELIEKIDPELLKKMYKDDPNSGYTYMTNEEKAVYQYYKETDSDKADKFYKSIVRTLNARAAQATSERIKEAGSTVLGDIGLAIASIIVAPLQAKALVGSGLDALGEYSPADPNKPYNAPAQFVSQARQEVTKDMSPVAAFFINTAMSGADMAVALGTGGTSAAPFVMASSAAGATANDMLQRGGSYGQAFFGGLATGAIEFATESISFGHLGKIQKGFKDLSAKQIAKNIASQAGIEGLEEVIAEIGGTISDNLIMGEKSNYNLSVKQYMAQGMTEAEAVKKTNMDFFGKQLMASFVGGALLGGVFGAGETLSNVRTNTKIDSAMEAAGIDVDSMTDAQLAQAREDFYNEAMKAIEQNDIQTTPDGQIDIGTIPDVLAEVEGLQAEAAPKPEVQTKEAILKQY
ncbi:MAG: hypothetical protein M0R40_10960, partial [Firmicutes bacterium]|nr:hypothetical protein [Bacillota bacterium]